MDHSDVSQIMELKDVYDRLPRSLRKDMPPEVESLVTLKEVAETHGAIESAVRNAQASGLPLSEEQIRQGEVAGKLANDAMEKFKEQYEQLEEGGQFPVVKEYLDEHYPPKSEYGPAVTLHNPANGIVTYEEWRRDGLLHRDDGPTIIGRNPTTGAVILERWFRNGELQEPPSTNIGIARQELPVEPPVSKLAP